MPLVTRFVLRHLRHGDPRIPQTSSLETQRHEEKGRSVLSAASRLWIMTMWDSEWPLTCSYSHKKKKKQQYISMKLCFPLSCTLLYNPLHSVYLKATWELSLTLFFLVLKIIYTIFSKLYKNSTQYHQFISFTVRVCVFLNIHFSLGYMCTQNDHLNVYWSIFHICANVKVRNTFYPDTTQVTQFILN